MKRTMILFYALVFIGCICNAQIDTVKNTSNKLIIKGVTDTSKYALLFVYRNKNFSGSIVGYDLKINNSCFKDYCIGRVKNNSKFVVKLYQEEKTEIFATTATKRNVYINVKYGQKYYLKCGVTMGLVVGRPELNLVYPEQGELDFENVKGRE
jgi:hypothetical protein